jgi:hypothetical protein
METNVQQKTSETYYETDGFYYDIDMAPTAALLFWINDQIGSERGAYWDTWLYLLNNGPSSPSEGIIGQNGYWDMTVEIYKNKDGILTAINNDAEYFFYMTHDDRGPDGYILNENIKKFIKEKIEKQGPYREPGSIIGENKWASDPDDWDENMIDEYIKYLYGERCSIDEAINIVSNIPEYKILAEKYIKN